MSGDDGMAPWRVRARRRSASLVAVYLLAPLVVVVIISFSSAPFLQFPPPGFSLRWYAQPASRRRPGSTR